MEFESQKDREFKSEWKSQKWSERFKIDREVKSE